nr:HAMP domain-containing sensor histidine kinase [Actinomyces gerencseriae]
MAAAMGALSTLTLRHTLMNRLDDQLTAASHRADVRRHGTKHDESALNDDARRSAEDAENTANGEKREEPDPSSAGPTAAPSSASSGQPPGACETRGPDGAKPVPAGLDAAGQPTGTLTLIASGARDDQNDGGADLASSTVTAGYIDDDGRYQELTRAECEALLSLEANGRPVTVDIGSLGSYRVLAAKDAETGDIVITGLSMKVDNALVRTQLLIEGAIAVAGTLVVALAGRAMVRSSLAPLARVACTAERVASQPLAHGEVSIDERVPEADLGSSLEVGQVGSALNTLLGHVDEALTARQRSETQVRQFVADASHELRTPLASIRGYAELIAREGADATLPEEAVHALDRVHSESLRMTRLVEDLLLLARLDAGRELRHDEVDLVGILLDAVSDAHAAGPDHTWDLDLAVLDAPADLSEDELEDFEPEPPLVLGDEARLRQVMVNLLANARVHTPAGSHVTVTLTRRSAAGADGGSRDGAGTEASAGPPAGARTSTGFSARAGAPGGPPARAVRGGEELVITIADDGPGIDPEVRSRMFERFARGDASRERSTGSTGLGMSIALAIIQSHGGTLTVDSQQAPEGSPEDAPHGTAFTVTLPAAE